MRREALAWDVEMEREAGWKVDDLRLAEEGSQSVRDKLAAAGGQ